MKKRDAALIVGAGLLLPASAATADIWNELTDGGADAGQSLATAQDTTSINPLSAIDGVLANGSDVDIYLISIIDEANFTAMTIGGTAVDTKLYLFKADGTGQVMNDDYGGTFQSKITSQGVFSNGTYYLAISRFGVGVRDAANKSLFTNTSWPGVDNNQQMPNAAAGPLHHWTTSTDIGGSYTIKLSGVGIPAPGAIALLGVAGLLGRRRRR